MIKQDCFIAYFDILGYEIKMEHDGEQLVQTIAQCIEVSHKLLNIVNDNFDSLNKRSFSDNFIFWSNRYEPLLNIVGHLQREFIRNGIFIRGSLCFGNIGATDEFVYGTGLIKAHKIENELAIYPRVIIDDSFINNMRVSEFDFINPNKYLQDYYFVDLDGYKYLDYLKIWWKFSKNGLRDIGVRFGDTVKSMGKTGESKTQFRDLLCEHREQILSNLHDAKKRNNRRIEQKFQWCANYHNRICDEFTNKLTDLRDLKITEANIIAK